MASPSLPSIGVETHGIAPVAASARYGRPSRLFTVWFAPNLTISSVFTGALSITLGLDFLQAMTAIILGTVLGATVPAYLGTFGPRTGSGQMPFARLPFGRSVVVPGVLAWGSAVAWDALVGLFGGQALQALTGLPFWASVVIVLALQAVVGFFGYELIHRFQMVVSWVLGAAFVLLTVRILSESHVATASTVHGGDLVGMWVLMFGISFSLSISWSPYASDFSRYLPTGASGKRMFWFTTLGLGASYVWGQLIGAAGASALGDATAAGVSEIMGGGVLGAIGLLTIVLASVSSNAMNDYSGSLSLQTIGVRLVRPVAALVSAAIAFVLVLWMSAEGALADRFENVLLFVSYWIPCFVAVVVIDWVRRRKDVDGTVDVAAALAHRHSGWPALVALLAGIASTFLFMNTSLLVGPVAMLLHGADLAFYVGFVVSGLVYVALLPLAKRTVAPMSAAGADPEADAA